MSDFLMDDKSFLEELERRQDNKAVKQFLNKRQAQKTKDDKSCHMIVAMRRNGKAKGENQGLSKLVIRKVVRPGEDYHIVAKEFSNQLSNEDGYWRMYRSVNKRDLTKAKQALQLKLIEDGDRISHKIDSEWKSILMKKECRAERRFLLDVDTIDEDVCVKALTKLDDLGVDILEDNQTPNGFHWVTTLFNPAEMSEFEDIDVKHDDLFYLFDFGDKSCK